MGGGGREMLISLDALRDKNLMQLKKLNAALFPVHYNDKYYSDALASADFTKLAYFSDICVGAIACKLEKKEGGSVRAYIMTLGTGAWESALTNTLSPGDRTVSFLIGQFSLLWIDQQQRLGFNVDVVESDWGQGANLDILASKLAADTTHSIKAICIGHNETTTGVTNNLATVRKLLDHYQHPALFLVDGVSSICALDFRMDEWGVDVALTGSQKAAMRILEIYVKICQYIFIAFLIV